MNAIVAYIYPHPQNNIVSTDGSLHMKNAIPDLTHLFLMPIVAGTEYTKVTKVIEGEPQIIEREIKKVHLEG